MPNPGETLWVASNGARIVYERERANYAAIAVYEDGLIVAPSVVSYALQSPSGAVLSTGLATLAGAAPATYTVAAAELPATLTPGPGYREVWTIQMPTPVPGVTPPPFKIRRQVAVGLFQLFPPVTVGDLVAGEYPDLTTSLGPEGVSTLNDLMTATWNFCIRYLERKGTWEDVVVDSADLFDWFRHETLARTFKAMLQMQDTERWRELWRHHQDKAEGMRQGLTFTPDRDRDGVQDHHGKEALSSTVHVNVPPRRRLRRSGKW